MSYFIVFQNKTYKAEKDQGFLWAPQKTKNGQTKYYWSNMKEIKKEDIIFSLYKRKLVSVNVAKDKCRDANKPSSLKSAADWENKGWKVEVEYNTLEKPINIDDYIEKILKKCPSKYSPFNSNGKGSQGYLFEIGNELGDYLMGLVKSQNKINIKCITIEEENFINETNEILNKFNDVTEKERLIKARVGQGLFKKKLLIRSCRCAICGINIKELLIASHCKPWKKSNNKEKLDVNNGILLCPTHDALFDKGMITFSNDGKIIISSKIDITQYKKLNINENIKINFKEDQLPYIKWHRENEYTSHKKDKFQNPNLHTIAN